MAIQMVDHRKLNVIKSEVNKAAQQMQYSRHHRAFTELEKALGYAAFQNWLATYIMMKDEKDPHTRDFFEECTHSARVTAISLMEKLYFNSYYRSLISNKVKFIDIHIEIELAKSLTVNPYWEDCTTRAVILICRQLAYNYIGVEGEASSRLARKELGWKDLANAVDCWLGEVLIN